MRRNGGFSWAEYPFMVQLQAFDCCQNLSNLVWLGFAPARLDIDPRVSGPGRFVDPMACPVLARLAEEVIADFAQIGEVNALGFLPHRDESVFPRSYREGTLRHLFSALDKDPDTLEPCLRVPASTPSDIARGA
jgi:hypothetical protein